MSKHLAEILSAKAGSPFKEDPSDIEDLKYFYYVG
jgi:hypothetical protein